jgi:hypothetical protein
MQVSILSTFEKTLRIESPQARALLQSGLGLTLALHTLILVMPSSQAKALPYT